MSLQACKFSAAIINWCIYGTSNEEVFMRSEHPFTRLRVSNGAHNGENDSHKRQFLALGVRSQSWKLNNLSKKISCQIDWCYKLLATN